MIAVLPLKPLEPPYPKSYNPNAKCNYNAGAMGHSMKRCRGFKHKVQDLVDGGWLCFKENEPNVNNNPFLPHEGQSINALSHESSGQESSKAGSRKDHMAQVAVIGQAGDLFLKPLIIYYDPIPAPQASHIIQVLAKPAYRDNHVVPWQYDLVTKAVPAKLEDDNPTKKVINIAKTWGVTRSGRIYTPDTLRKKGPPAKARDAATKPTNALVGGKEAKEFLKLIRHSEYQLLNQMNKTPARFSPGYNSREVQRHDKQHHQWGCLTFSEEEVPAKGKGHNQPLHISVKCGDYIIARLLIDNGSSLNVLPKATLDKLCSINSQLRTSSMVVRAFDGSKREVIGEITLPIYIGPTIFDVTFQVMDIHPMYSCLLGRPWIHAARVVPSSLH
ncbi:hypothetical protein CR513_25463, partial [Mucuna pruriens]